MSEWDKLVELDKLGEWGKLCEWDDLDAGASQVNWLNQLNWVKGRAGTRQLYNLGKEKIKITRKKLDQVNSANLLFES